MLPLNLPQSRNAPFKILCFGAHADDIEIGCGGTVLQLLSSNRSLEFPQTGLRIERNSVNRSSLYIGQKPRVVGLSD